jgi:hypothetical protein
MHLPPDEQSGAQSHAESGQSPAQNDAGAGEEKEASQPSQVSTAPEIASDVEDDSQSADVSDPPSPASSGQDSGAAAQAGPVPPDRPDYKAVARISTQAVLEGIQLAFLHADLLREVKMPENWTDGVRTSSSASAEFDREALRLIVYCEFGAVWAPDLQDDSPLPSSKEPPFELRARFRLEYAIKNLDGIEVGDEEHFARTNGKLHAWPYWREIAQSTTLRMGLVPLVVGTFKIPWSGDPGRRPKRVEQSEEERTESQDAEQESTQTEPAAEQPGSAE